MFRKGGAFHGHVSITREHFKNNLASPSFSFKQLFSLCFLFVVVVVFYSLGLSYPFFSSLTTYIFFILSLSYYFIIHWSSCWCWWWAYLNQVHLFHPFTNEWFLFHFISYLFLLFLFCCQWYFICTSMSNSSTSQKGNFINSIRDDSWLVK